MTRGRTVLSNLTAATMSAKEDGYGLIHDAAIAIEADKICWVGPLQDLPEDWNDVPRTDLNGCLATPSLIDCHTHIVYGGSRAREFEMRLNGATYEEIARSGGGIRSTVAATRSASEDELLAGALPRVDALLAEGVTLLEIKSGYGLDLETELKMLRVARRIGELRPVKVLTTFLGAHALPPEYEGRSDATSASYAMRCFRLFRPRSSRMRWMLFARASPFHLSRFPECLIGRGRLGCLSKSIPSNFPILVEAPWQPATKRFLLIIWSIWMGRVFKA